MSLFVKCIPSLRTPTQGSQLPAVMSPSTHCSSSPCFLASRHVPPPLLFLYTHPALFSHPPAIPTWEGPFLSSTTRSSSGSFLTYFHIFHWPTGIRVFSLSKSTLHQVSLLHPTASVGTQLWEATPKPLKEQKIFISLLQTLGQAQN